MYLQESFRCGDRIANTASTFVLRNPAQLTKTVKGSRILPEPAIFVVRPEPSSQACGLKTALGNIAKEAKKDAGVMLIGRYNYLKPRDLPQLQSAFPSLRLSFRTAHGAKGLEDDYVVILGLRSGRMGFPSEIVDDPVLDLVLAAAEAYPHAEERRLLYVAMTRARYAVYLLADSKEPSRFVSELAGIDCDVHMQGAEGRADVPCPVCREGRLTLRTGKNGAFVGCSLFPYCDFTEPACPHCSQGMIRMVQGKHACSNDQCRYRPLSCASCHEGWMLVRTTRAGKALRGCSRYPRCRHLERAT
jgi:DNA helicase-4